MTDIDILIQKRNSLKLEIENAKKILQHLPVSTYLGRLGTWSLLKANEKELANLDKQIRDMQQE